MKVKLQYGAATVQGGGERSDFYRKGEMLLGVGGFFTCCGESKCG